MNNAKREQMIEAACYGHHDEAYVLFRTGPDMQGKDYAAIYEASGGRLIATLDTDATVALRTMHPESARLMILAMHTAYRNGEYSGERIARAAA